MNRDPYHEPHDVMLFVLVTGSVGLCALSCIFVGYVWAVL